uniref:Uncharacterized protein n=1 Tax=Panagrolaimus sp. JU765 TaxID=591449 RepID=A0AC34QYX8_9BILA
MLTRDSVKNQNSERVDQIINELNSKLLALSGQDCDIEVDIRIKFPNASGSQSNSRRSQTSGTPSRRSSRTSEDSRRSSSRRCAKKQRHRHHHHHHRHHRQNKVDDFAFDVGDYARVDRGDKEASDRVSLGPKPTKADKRKSPDVVTLGGIVDRGDKEASDRVSLGPKPTKADKRKSPDVVTLGGMCNADSNYTPGNPSVKTKSKYSSTSSAPSSNYSSLSSTNIFPKADMRYK